MYKTIARSETKQVCPVFEEKTVESISYDNNRYANCASYFIQVIIFFLDLLIINSSLKIALRVKF